MKKLNREEINRRFNEICKLRGKDIHQVTKDLGKEYNVSWVTIRKELEKENLEKAKNLLTKQQEIVYNKLKSGNTQSSIAKELNVSRQNVGYMLKIIKKKGYNIEISGIKKD